MRDQICVCVPSVKLHKLSPVSTTENLSVAYMQKGHNQPTDRHTDTHTANVVSVYDLANWLFIWCTRSESHRITTTRRALARWFVHFVRHVLSIRLSCTHHMLHIFSTHLRRVIYVVNVMRCRTTTYTRSRTTIRCRWGQQFKSISAHNLHIL